MLDTKPLGAKHLYRQQCMQTPPITFWALGVHACTNIRTNLGLINNIRVFIDGTEPESTPKYRCPLGAQIPARNHAKLQPADMSETLAFREIEKKFCTKLTIQSSDTQECPQIYV